MSGSEHRWAGGPGRGVRPDPALVRLMMGFYDAVLSMQLRHWLAQPDEPRDARPTRTPSPPTDDLDPPIDDRDGGAAARIPRPRRPGPFRPPAAAALDEPWIPDEAIADALGAISPNSVGGGWERRDQIV